MSYNYVTENYLLHLNAQSRNTVTMFSSSRPLLVSKFVFTKLIHGVESKGMELDLQSHALSPKDLIDRAVIKTGVISQILFRETINSK